MNNNNNIVPYGYRQDTQVLAGTESVYGNQPGVAKNVISQRVAGSVAGTMRAPESGVPYIAAKKRCAWNNYQCKAQPAKSTPLCFGHLQHFIKTGDGQVMGEEAQRLIQYREQFKEIEKQRLADKATEKEQHWAEHGPKDEVADGS